MAAQLLTVEFPRKLECLSRPSRYKVLYGGRGSGKSWGVARQLIVFAVERKIRVLCCREVQKSIQDSVHKLLCDQISAMGVGAFFTITETQIRAKNGSEFFFTGIRGQSIDNLKSYEGIDYCWVEEAQVVTRKSWGVLIPTIRKEKSEIWITFNPELDTDETYVRFVLKPPPDAIIEFLNWRDNEWFPPVLVGEKNHLRDTDPVSYENIWEGKCRTAVDGAIYPAEIGRLLQDGRLRNVPYDPMMAVHTVWDLGWNDKMAIILAQRHGAELRIIEYIEDSHLTLADYVGRLDGLGYRWGADWLPHDGATKDYKTGMSAEEILRRMGRQNVQIVPKMDIEQGIKAVRLLFPRLYVDSDKAGALLDRVKRYRRTIPTSTGEARVPLHDENSHAADALRYLAIVADKFTTGETMSRKPLSYPKRSYA